MTISRRLALGWASALALTGGTTQVSLASAIKSASKALAPRKHPPQQSSFQLFLEQLIHRDESNHVPHYAEVSVAAPDTAWYAVDTLDGPKYRMTNTFYKKRGYRLRRVSAFKTKEGTRFSAIWELISGPEWHSAHGMKQAAFDTKTATYAANGYRLAFVDARVDYAAIWERGDPSSQMVFSSLSANEFQQQVAALAPQGYCPVRISSLTSSGDSRFAVIFEKQSMDWHAQVDLSFADFRKTCAIMKAQGYRMTDASGHVLNKKPIFSGIWQKA